MIDFFARLPGVVTQLVASHVMTAILVATVALSAGWLIAVAAYQAHVRRGDTRRAARRAKPGSFPGDQN